jgi:hypothetical protein
MGHITLNELSDNLKDYLEALGEKQGDVTSETIGELGNLTTTNKANIVAAINELDQNLNALNAAISEQLAQAATVVNDTIDLL